MTTADKKFSDCQKLCLPLKARTGRKRLREAEKALCDVYPFKVNGANIFIARTGRKGLYDVYISKNKIKRTGKTAAAVLIALAALVPAISGGAVLQRRMHKNEAASLAQKERERKKQEELKVRAEKEARLESLRKEYEEKESGRYEKIYPYIGRICSAMSGSATIETILIENDSFSVEVTARDAVNILSSFEKSGAFSQIQMNRASVSKGLETVTYSGSFSRMHAAPGASFSTDEKISFYTQELEKMHSREKRMENIPLSKYIQGIREVLRRNGCREQYIQLRRNGLSAEVEFFILSSSRSILHFISEIQDCDDNLIDIKQIRIRNSEEASRVQTTIRFDSGIELKQDDMHLAEYEEQKIPSSQIDSIFYKAPRKISAARKPYTPHSPVHEQKSIPVRHNAGMKSLSYIGLTKAEGKTMVIAKDSGMGSIYTLPVSETETAGNFCMKTDGGYTARLWGEYYEVKK